MTPGGAIEADVAVVGAGIAGVSVAAELARGASVVLLEREPVAAYHTTGRSAAMYLASYGGPAVRGLTEASRGAFAAAGAPGAASLLTPRPLLWVTPRGQERLLEPLAADNPSLVRLDPDGALRHCPVLRPDWCGGALLEDGALEIDVLGLHQRYLAAARRGGARLLLHSALLGGRHDGARWRLETTSGAVAARVVVDAAGAWADQVAVTLGVPPLGLRPLLRTIAISRGGEVDRALPLVADAGETFYFRPEGTGYLLSPADETPSQAVDARPDDLAVATAMERVNEATTLRLRSIRTAWAGLRTFAPDRVPVAGADPLRPDFVWLAGQGGYGIQTAPALARLAAAAVTGGEAGLPAWLVAAVAPARFAQRVALR